MNSLTSIETMRALASGQRGHIEEVSPLRVDGEGGLCYGSGDEQSCVAGRRHKYLMNSVEQ
jgi:hypothetical protein